MNIRKIRIQWILYLIIVTLLLIVFNIIFYIYIKQHCYNSAQKSLNSNAKTTNFKIESVDSNNSTSLNYEIKKIIENFKSENETIAIGFNIEEKAIVSSNKNICKAYEDLLKLIKQKKQFFKNEVFHCHLKNGEHLMIKIKPISNVNCEFSTIIYILSLKKFDNFIIKSELICIVVALILIFLMFLSGQFFIKKLLKPIIEISKITKKIANNQTNLKLKVNFNFELENLCNSINLLNKKLHRSEYMQNEFISSISHELRTPLTAIKGWSETILNSNYNQQIVDRGIKIISKEIVRLSKMVEELLDFSKIKNKRLKLFKEKMDPFAELQEAILIYDKVAKKQNKTLTYEEQAIIPTIFGDRNRIKQVFINIIDNALKYSNKGAVVRISAIVSEQTADIIIKDNGKGIAKHDLDHITEKFFKANNLSKGSSGIGLAVAKEIIQKHNGTLKFESKLNKGTTVKISFPLFKKIN